MSIQHMNIIGTDPLRHDYLLPARVVWASEGVQNAENLLQNAARQTYVGFGGGMTVFSTYEGKKAAVVLDFGTELAGGVRITSHMSGSADGEGDKERSFIVRFGESVSEVLTPVPQKGATNDHATREHEIKVPWLGSIEVGQTGFRFVYLELTQADQHSELVAVQGVFTYRDVPYRGSFECSDERLTEIFDTSAYTAHLCMQRYLWDGVKRDRLIWFGDIHPEVLAIRTVFGHNEVVDDSLRFLGESDLPPRWPNHMATYALWYIRSVWDWYLHNGDESLLVELKPLWFALLKQLLGLMHEEGAVLRVEEFSNGFFFDWPTKEMVDASKAGTYALMAITLEAGARLCRHCGEEETAAACEHGIQLLRKEQLAPHGMKQVAAMMNLAGHMSDAEAGPFLTENGGAGMSTFHSYYILKAVTKSAGIESALSMLREYYGAMLDAGATTFWEDFDLAWVRPDARIDRVLAEGEYDIHGDNGKFCYVGLRHSLCHGWSAGPTAFLADTVLGIEILEPGCRKVAVKPQLGNLEWAKGTYPTPYGDITVSVTKEGVQVTAPAEVEIVR